ncbi:MAG: 30S ribosomal protein S6e, partial [Candidatus Korarchaeota archaeon]|nr:30S ribosomal protein S6e [Candidatus Korarchaeota archaeon]
ILGGGVGFNPNHPGERRRKTVRGNVITDDIVQINMKIIEKPKKSKKSSEKEKESRPK